MLRSTCHPLRRLVDASAVSRRQLHSHQTVLDAVQEIRERLSRPSDVAAASTVPESARNDAKALVANALDPPLASSNDVFFHGDRKLTEQEAEKLSASVDQRAKGEPLAYVIGRKEFWSLEFKVTKDTLIPRSDSEVLIETLVDQFHPQIPLRILDIGTGSGCLLLSALSEFPHATGVGVDISPGALAVAQKNAHSNSLDGRAEFLLRDLHTLLNLRADVADDETLYQQFDVILCNPPYIPTQELHLVGPDVLEYEPHLALFSDGGPTIESTGVDPEGLQMYRLLHRSVANLFRSGSESAGMNTTAKSCLLMEIGSEDQARAVRKLFSDTDVRGATHGAVDNRPPLRFERFLFDASEKYRGLLFVAPLVE